MSRSNLPRYVSIPLAGKLLGRSRIWAWQQAKAGSFGPLEFPNGAHQAFVRVDELERRFGRTFTRSQIDTAAGRTYTRDDVMRFLCFRDRDWEIFCQEKFDYRGPGPDLDETLLEDA